MLKLQFFTQSIVTVISLHFDDIQHPIQLLLVFETASANIIGLLYWNKSI